MYSKSVHKSHLQSSENYHHHQTIYCDLLHLTFPRQIASTFPDSIRTLSHPPPYRLGIDHNGFNLNNLARCFPSSLKNRTKFKPNHHRRMNVKLHSAKHSRRLTILSAIPSGKLWETQCVNFVYPWLNVFFTSWVDFLLVFQDFSPLWHGSHRRSQDFL